MLDIRPGEAVWPASWIGQHGTGKNCFLGSIGGSGDNPNKKTSGTIQFGRCGDRDRMDQLPRIERGAVIIPSLTVR